MGGYFDHNATTPLHPAAAEAWQKAQRDWWYNASGLYREAAAAKTAIEDTRELIADSLDVEPEEIIFTSGATEANNALITWLALADSNKDRLFHYSMLEHPSLREPAQKWLKPRVRLLPVKPDGTPLAPRADFAGRSVVSLMAANNETGILQPWQALAAQIRNAEEPSIFHCDATQWFGKMPLKQPWQLCDFLTASAHKFGGPKGVGFLRVSARCRGFHGFLGGPQEQRRRAGTENTPAIFAMRAAWENMSTMNSDGRDAFEHALTNALTEVRIIGQEVPRLPNTSLLVLPHGKNTQWLARLSHAGFAVSTGSACSSGQGASEVLTAMGFAESHMSRVLRISSGADTTLEAWQEFLSALVEVATSLQ
jgi:cysteine desulfurase